MKLARQIENRSRWVIVLACLGLQAVVGVVDYLTGFEIFFSVFYLLGVGLGTWFLSRSFGYFMSILSVTIWIAGDLAAGAHYSTPFIPIWNALILMVFYFIVVWLLANLRALQQGLESKVQQRTAELTQEISERERLEKEILEVSEREQRRIGHDIHDSLCQHLTATALAGRVLSEKLTAKSLNEAGDADHVVELVEDGIQLARGLARGIAAVAMDAEGLMMAFQELASKIENTSKIECDFLCEEPVLIHDATTATHLYRIAQEAVSNAVRHGKPRRILINLLNRAGRTTLTIEDDGSGLPEGWQKGGGMGTRIMAHRAAMMNAAISIEPNPTGGTLVECTLPSAVAATRNGEAV